MTPFTIRLHFGDDTDDDGINGSTDVVIRTTDTDAAIDLANRLYPSADRYEVVK